MSKAAFFPTLLVTLLVCLLPVAPAQATGVGRTFVSAAGSDSNNCANVMSPCRHLATAYAATAPNGEIYVLDPANYGSLTITGPVSIEGHGWASIAAVSGSSAITISANPSDIINIIGVVLDGTAIATTTGIRFNSGGRLNIRDSVIRNFTQDGIHFAPNSSTLSQLYVTNTLISDNGADGIAIESAGSGSTTSVLEHVQMENNGVSGLDIPNASQPMVVTVSNCVSASNAGSGIFAFSSTTPVAIMVRNTTIANNDTGLTIEGADATLWLAQSTLTGNANEFFVQGGAINSYGDNYAAANPTSTGSLGTATRQ